MNTKVAKAIVGAITAIVVLVSNPFSSQAGTGGVDSKKSSITDEQVAVKYIGTTDNNIIFKVEFDNPTAQKFSLIIRNDNGEIVYHQSFTDSHFSKSVYFQNTDTEIHPTFVIRNEKNEIVRQFAVSQTLTENTVVTPL